MLQRNAGDYVMNELSKADILSHVKVARTDNQKAVWIHGYLNNLIESALCAPRRGQGQGRDISAVVIEGALSLSQL